MLLPRLQLFEFEDLTWFPRTIRGLATDYLHLMQTCFALHEAVIPLLKTMLEESKASELVDLCSGGGGPVLAVFETQRNRRRLTYNSTRRQRKTRRSYSLSGLQRRIVSF